MFKLGTAATAVDASLPWCAPDRSKALLTLLNGSAETLGFKILTNAPQRWSVRPAFGLLRPGASAEVTLALTADAQADSEDRHLVLSVPLGAEEVALLAKQREANERVSIERLSPTNPTVSQIRLALAQGAGGEAAEGSAADAAAGSSIAVAPPRHLAPTAAADAGGPRGGLVALVQAFLRSTFDEVEPWFKWKMYDILFALLLLRLGRRYRPIRWLQNWLRELDAS